MSMPFIEMPQRNEASPSITSKPPAPTPRPPPTQTLYVHPPRHHVLGDRGSGVPMHGYSRLLVHSGRVVSGMPFDFDVDRRVDAHRDAVRAVGVRDAYAHIPSGNS
jgi:hypothetical protein